MGVVRITSRFCSFAIGDLLLVPAESRFALIQRKLEFSFIFCSSFRREREYGEFSLIV